MRSTRWWWPRRSRSAYNLSFTVYILRCADGSYYAGQTDDLEARLEAHERGDIESYTKSRRPVILAFHEEFPTRAEALGAERQIKGWARDKKEALILGDWDLLTRLAGVRGSRASPRTVGHDGKPGRSS